jgi:hypothetical protein
MPSCRLTAIPVARLSTTTAPRKVNEPHCGGAAILAIISDDQRMLIARLVQKGRSGYRGVPSTPRERKAARRTMTPRVTDVIVISREPLMIVNQPTIASAKAPAATTIRNA